MAFYMMVVDLVYEHVCVAIRSSLCCLLARACPRSHDALLLTILERNTRKTVFLPSAIYAEAFKTSKSCKLTVNVPIFDSPKITNLANPGHRGD